MKIIAIGDIHGRDRWKQIVTTETFDKVVFVGDYFDSFDVCPQEQKDNFRDIIAFKKANREKVILLFGNHDFHYLRGIDDRYPGYQPYSAIDYSEMLHEALAENLMQMCYVWIGHISVIFVHAGITKTWCRDNYINPQSPEKGINELFKYQPQSFRFTSGPNKDKYGDDVTQSPIWVRPRSLAEDKLDNFIQVVGHTEVDNITCKDGIIQIDTLGKSGEYFVYYNGTCQAKKVKLKEPHYARWL